jgi:hypothetical protein
VDFLRSLLGMFTSSVLRLAVSVGILVAAYFLIVRPVLDTTNKAIDAAGTQFGVNSNLGQAIRQSDVNPNVGRQIRRSIRQANRQVQRQINRSLRQTAPTGGRQKKLLHCVQHAHGNVNRIQRCARRF